MKRIAQSFFTPDSIPVPGEKLRSSKHGCNLKFMKLMVQQGFDQEIHWSTGSTAPRHFELVERVNSIHLW
jgi:hypothetical protein